MITSNKGLDKLEQSAIDALFVLKQCKQNNIGINTRVSIDKAINDIETSLKEYQKGVNFVEFEQWMIKEMPEFTVIGDPKFWARKIYAKFINLKGKLP